MNFPSLPTDSLYKFLFISGIVLFIFSYIITRDTQYRITDNYIEQKNSAVKTLALLDKHFQNYRQSSQDLQSEIKKSIANSNYNTSLVHEKSVEINGNIKNGKINEYNADSALKKNVKFYELLANSDKELKRAKNLVDSSKKISSESKNVIDLETAKMDSLNERWNTVNARLEKEVVEMEYCKIIGIFLSVIGLIGWVRVQNAQDKILFRQFKEAVKEDGLCQSCGMVLKYDSLYKEGNKYCHNCFDGEKFIEPEMKLPELKSKIRTKMKEQGFGKFETWIKVSSLSNLDRWKRDFKW